VDPVPDPLLFFLVVPGIEPGPPDLYNSSSHKILSTNSPVVSQTQNADARGTWAIPHLVVVQACHKIFASPKVLM
jgi:hypothetical protein